MDSGALTHLRAQLVERHGYESDQAEIRSGQVAPQLYSAIFILGPSSSGKTTLCDALSIALQIRPPSYIKEVARTVMKTQGFTRNDTDTYEMQHAIMTAQLDAEKNAVRSATVQKAAEIASAVVLSDRSALDPVVYATTSKTPGTNERRERLLNNSELKAALPFYRRSLFVVLEAVKEWIEDDGVRLLQDPWNYRCALHALLHELAIPFVIIGEEMKDIDKRVDFVKMLLYQSMPEWYV